MRYTKKVSETLVKWNLFYYCINLVRDTYLVHPFYYRPVDSSNKLDRFFQCTASLEGNTFPITQLDQQRLIFTYSRSAGPRQGRETAQPNLPRENYESASPRWVKEPKQAFTRVSAVSCLALSPRRGAVSFPVGAGEAQTRRTRLLAPPENVSPSR